MSKLHGIRRVMDAYDIPHTPDGYEVVYDASMNLYYPVQKATAGRGHARQGWDYISNPDDRGHACFELRDDAVRFCISHSQRMSEPQDSAVCALADCDEPAAYTCVCCNRRVCFYDVCGTDVDVEPGLCHECLYECAGGMACKVVMHG